MTDNASEPLLPPVGPSGGSDAVSTARVFIARIGVQAFDQQSYEYTKWEVLWASGFTFDEEQATHIAEDEAYRRNYELFAPIAVRAAAENTRRAIARSTWEKQNEALVAAGLPTIPAPPGVGDAGRYADYTFEKWLSEQRPTRVWRASFVEVHHARA